MKMRIKPLVVDVIEDDGMWLDMSTMTYYDKDSLEPIYEHEVALEKEFEDYLDNVEGQPRMCHPDEQIEWAKDIARHFYELGLNARKEK